MFIGPQTFGKEFSVELRHYYKIKSALLILDSVKTVMSLSSSTTQAFVKVLLVPKFFIEVVIKEGSSHRKRN